MSNHISPVDPVYIKICLGTLFFYYFAATVRSFILKGLLSYHGWIFDSPRSQSLQTKIWFILMKIFTFRNPKLDAFQGKSVGYFVLRRMLSKTVSPYPGITGARTRPRTPHVLTITDHLRLSTETTCSKAE